MQQMKLSVVIPARDEEENIGPTLQGLMEELIKFDIPREIIVVNDNSEDGTVDVVKGLQEQYPEIRIVHRTPPGGFGRAVRDGLAAVTGDVVVIFMGDQSDDPHDIVVYYKKILEGYDCVFGSRFIKGSDYKGYPRLKLLLNRIANTLIRVLFWTSYNDMTNAFKGYRTSVVRQCGPFNSCHFNITIEIPLAAYIRGYSFAVVPIKWYGRTAGVSRFPIRRMGRRYLSTLLKCFFEYRLVKDDLIADRRVQLVTELQYTQQLEARISQLESRVTSLEDGQKKSTEE